MAGRGAGRNGASGTAAAVRPVLPDLSPDAVIETACLVGPEGPRPLGGGPLPPSIRGLIQRVKAYEQLTIEAAVTGDRHKAFLALLSHPLVPGVAVAEGLLGDILGANRDYLAWSCSSR